MPAPTMAPGLLFHATRSVRYLQFLSEHKRRCRDASKSREVQRVRRKIGRGSRVGDRSRQIRVRFGKADGRLRPRDLERPGGRGALLGILDRATKPVGRSARKLLRRLVQELRETPLVAFSWSLAQHCRLSHAARPESLARGLAAGYRSQSGAPSRGERCEEVNFLDQQPRSS